MPYYIVEDGKEFTREQYEWAKKYGTLYDPTGTLAKYGFMKKGKYFSPEEMQQMALDDIAQGKGFPYPPLEDMGSWDE